MRTMSAMVMALLWVVLAQAGEPAVPPPAPEAPKAEPAKPEPPKPPESAVPKMDAKRKMERIDKTAAQIAQWEKMLASLTPEAIERARKSNNPNLAANKEKLKAEIENKLPISRIELRWLKGELTPAGAEAAVKSAEEALAKAEKDKAPLEAPKAALEKATFARDEVNRLEEAEKPKQKEPEA